MGQVKDPTIKLFGQNIELPETCAAAEEEEGIGGAPEDSLTLMPEDGNLITNGEDQKSHKVLFRMIVSEF